MDPEFISPRYHGLDTWSDAEILDSLWEGQARAIAAVRPALAAISSAAEAMVGRLRADGRIIYAGAGSSGQQAALDGMELPATFGWPADRLLSLLAERRRSPGSPHLNEDDFARGRATVRELSVGAADVVIAVAASGTTPYTVAVAQESREVGALVISIANKADAPILSHADFPILLETGSEVIAGSTRMNAGTAQKVALGLLSTLVMTRLGRVHDGLMVSMRVDRSKFSRRAIGIVAAIAGCPETVATQALEECEGNIKLAVLIAKGVDPIRARRILSECGDVLRSALVVLDQEDSAVSS